MANKESSFNTATSLREYLNSKLVTDTPKSTFLKITNINAPNAGPFSSTAEPAEKDYLFRNGNIIHDTQLVWVGNQFYIQGRKIKESYNSSDETYSPTYLFPFSAIAVEFIELINDNTIYFDVNDQDTSKATIDKTYLITTVGQDQGTFPTPTRASDDDYNYTFLAWYDKAVPDGTASSASSTISITGGTANKVTSTTETRINGRTLYAAWNRQAKT